MLKDSSAVLDYGLTWSSWLGDETIVTSSWTVDAGLVKDSDTHDATTTTVWLSGGVTGKSYRAVNRITTAAGRTDERTLTVSIRER